MKKWLIIVGIGIVACALIGWGLFESSRMSVVVANVEVGTIQAIIDERAVTELRSTYVITMPESGMHLPEAIEEGQEVEQDELVASVSIDDVEQEVRALQAVVDRVKAQIDENDDSRLEKLARQQAEQFVESMKYSVEAAVVRTSSSEERMQFAERAYGREQQLYDDNATSQERLERIQLDFIEAQKNYSQDNLILSAFRAVQAATNLLPGMVDDYIAKKQLSTAVLRQQLEEAQAQLDIAKRKADRAKIKSPIKGVVLSHEEYHNQFLPAGTELMEIGDLGELQIRAEILSQDVTNIAKRNEVSIYGATLNREPNDGLEGAVSEISVQGETKLSSLNVEQTRVGVVIKPDQRSLLELRSRGVGVNYQLRVRIVTDTQNSAVIVPRSAIFRGENGEWHLFAVVSGKVQLREVSVGIINDQQVQIRSGIEPDELVVVAPENQLSNGTRVKITY